MPPCQSRIRHGSTVYSNAVIAENIALYRVQCIKHWTVQCSVQNTLHCTLQNTLHVAHDIESAAYTGWRTFSPSSYMMELSVQTISNWNWKSDMHAKILGTWSFLYNYYCVLCTLQNSNISLQLCFTKKYCCRENWCHYHEVFIVIYSGFTKQPFLFVQ